MRRRPESGSCATARRRTLSLWPHVPKQPRGYIGARRRSPHQPLSVEDFVRNDNLPFSMIIFLFSSISSIIGGYIPVIMIISINYYD